MHMNDHTIDAIFSASGFDIFAKRFVNTSERDIIKECKERVDAISKTGILIRSNHIVSGLYYIYNGEPQIFDSSTKSMNHRIYTSTGDVFRITNDVDTRRTHTCFVKDDGTEYMEKDINSDEIMLIKIKDWCSNLYKASLENLLQDNKILHMVLKENRRYLFGLSTDETDRYIGEVPSFWSSLRKTYIATFLFTSGGGLSVGHIEDKDVHKNIFGFSDSIKEETLFTLIDVFFGS